MWHESSFAQETCVLETLGMIAWTSVKLEDSSEGSEKGRLCISVLHISVEEHLFSVSRRTIPILGPSEAQMLALPVRR